MSKQTFNSEEELREHVAYVIKEAQLRFKTAPESPSGVVGIASGVPKGSRCARGSKLFSITFKGMQYQNTHVILMLENPALYTALCVHNYHNPESPYVVGRKSTSMMYPNYIGNLVVCPLDVLLAYQKDYITESELVAKSMSSEAPLTETKLEKARRLFLEDPERFTGGRLGELAALVGCNRKQVERAVAPIKAEWKAEAIQHVLDGGTESEGAAIAYVSLKTMHTWMINHQSAQESHVEAEEIQPEPIEPTIDLQSMSVSQLRAYLDSLGFTVGDITINHNHPIMQ